MDALKRFRSALLRFCETAERALGEVDSDIRRTIDWVDHTQTAHWRGQITERTDNISSARAAVFRREMRSLSDTPGATEERKNLTAARVRLREAEDRTRTVKAWSRRLHEESDRYYAMVERLSSAVRTELPEAAIRLGRMIENLEAYLAIAGPEGSGSSAAAAARASAEAGGGPAASMSRGEGPAGGTPPPWWGRLRDRAGLIGRPPPLSGAVPEAIIDGSDVAGRLPGVSLRQMRAGDTIVVEQGALAQREFFLLRRRIDGREGGEWVIGLTAEEAPVRQPVRVPLGTIAARLNEWAGLLLLPEGWLVVIKEGRIRLVADAEDRERLNQDKGEPE